MSNLPLKISILSSKLVRSGHNWHFILSSVTKKVFSLFLRLALKHKNRNKKSYCEKLQNTLAFKNSKLLCKSLVNVLDIQSNKYILNHISTTDLHFNFKDEFL